MFSCRGESIDDIQNIDQILKVYIKDSSGNDLLNTNVAGAFYSVDFKDLGASYDRVAVSTSLKTDAESVKYKEYIAGATRILQPDATDTYKIYKSEIAVQYKTTSTSDIEEDIMEIYYEWTPQVFRITSVTYNDVEVFQKVEGQPNIITIVK